MNKFLSLGLFASLTIGQAMACSCMEGYPSARDVLDESYSVFLGIPAEDSKITGGTRNYPRLRTKFTVVSNFKNANTSSVDVYSDQGDGGNCGVDFKKHEGVLLVQTYKDQGKVWTSVCSVDSIEPDNVELTKLLQELTQL